ncbi:EcoAI/FtnUII family type I restriction enzme subunit R [Limosilactobacillus reuteri]|uniref:DEAD/DEAH box helicase n=1 Tax=Limosilactobacillus reuteri TaxID=1598 RepID=A0AAW9U2U4_LIMRT|nr:DEAD/DEAH box helicase family protein [Limosilactobacillus reuteri]MRG74653.1 DEAD/DEAH box helicase [Limosilactobacillus reuteri]OUL55514.1 restriction endonuclease subunit R [Limosilactobacillus reuteri]
MVNKKELSEEDVKTRYITPAIEDKGWTPQDWRMEYEYTDGRITVVNNTTKRGERKKIDYLLNYHENVPLAIIEAKDLRHTYDHGMQQGIDYAEGLKHAKSLQVPFVYASNGEAFLEHDMLTGKERKLAMNEFPTKEELWERFKQEKGLTPNQIKVINEPYYSTRESRKPRYYQRIAINRSVNAITNGQRRVMLVMATGTGKTFTAFQIVYRLLQSGIKKRVLYLADRNILVDQAMTDDFSPLLSKATKVQGGKMDSSYQIHFALYQQLAGREEDAGHEPFRQFKPDFFDLVVIDEAHRGSAKKDSQWRKILDYFDGPNVTHFGMTATPKNEKGASNIDYFGEPIYTYSLKQGIDDGFLAPYRVIRVNFDVDINGFRPTKGEKDANGQVIEDRQYTSKDFDRTMIIADRTKKVAKYVSDYLKKNHERFNKTIIFCEDIDHAERMRTALVNENADLVRQNPKYVMKITGDDKVGKSQLSNFEDVTSKYPVLVTTSKLLTTGVNVKTCKLIVLDQNINSMTEFKQIIGRGTRLDEAHGKTFFTIMDFKGVSRLFADPKFDGEPEDTVIDDDGQGGVNFNNGDKKADKKEKSDIGDKVSEGRTKYLVNNKQVQIVNSQAEYLDADGKLITTSLRDYTKKNVLGQYATLDKFIEKWRKSDNKQELLDDMENHGIFYKEIISDENLKDLDPFDLLVHLAYNQKPLSKSERVANVKKSGLLDKYQGEARTILETLLDKYKNDGIEELESRKTLSLPEFEQYGGPVKIILKVFGGKKNYQNAVSEMKEKIYS